MQPKVSVLIPAYNAAATLEAAVDTCRAQDWENLEIVIVDDGSADETAALSERLSQRFDCVRAFSLPTNRGPGAARQFALERATGEWVALLDVDDTWKPDRLARLLRIAERDHLGAIADNLDLVDPGDGQIVRKAFPLDDDDAMDLDIPMFLRNSVPGGYVNLGWMKPLIRRDLLVRNGVAWPQIRHAEDFVFAIRLLGSDVRIRLVGWAGYRYTQRFGSRTGTASAQSRTRRSVREQLDALDLVRREIERRPSDMLGVSSRLRRMKAEIRATAAMLDARDAWASGHVLAAGDGALRALARPLALARCILARYGPGSRRIR